MKNIFSGSFEQVEDLISEEYAKEKYEGVKKTRFINLIVIILFFNGGMYAIYGVIRYLSLNMDELTVPLDQSNEFIGFLLNIWYMHIFALPLIIGLFLGYINKNKDRIKASLMGMTAFTLYSLLFSIFFLLMAEFFVTNFLIRMLYLLFFILTLLWVFQKSYQNTVKRVFGERKGELAIIEWINKNKKTLSSTLIGIGGLSYFFKTIYEPAADFETNLVGSLFEFYPLFACLSTFSFILLFDYFIRNYYLYKYSEQFRQKFNVNKKDWYGEKHKVK